MKLSSILQKVETLPPLQRTVIEIEEFRAKEEKEIAELLNIIEKDALIVSSILRIANSAMFGFRSKVETPARAVSLLGINFTVSIAISSSTQKLIETSLDAYGVSNDRFMRASNIASVLANLWLNKVDTKLKDEIILPALLQEVGKYVLSDFIKSEQKEAEFKSRIASGESIEKIEKDITGTTTSYVTAQIFKHWKLSTNLINSIEFVDDIENVEDEFKNIAQILDVIKTASNILDPLSKSNIEKALKKAKDYNLDLKPLQEAIETIQNRTENIS